MRAHLTKLVRHTFIYGLGRVFGKLVSFLLIPFYTHYFTTADYGAMEILNLTAMVAGMILAPGLSNAVMRFYYDTDDESERRRAVSTALGFSIIVGAAAASVAILGAPFIARHLLGSGAFATSVKLLALGFFFSFFSDICLVSLRSKQRSTTYVVLTQGFFLLSVSLNIYLVGFRRMGLVGVFWGNAMASGVLGIALLWLTVRDVGIRFSGTKLWAMLRFGAPLILTWVAGFVLNFSDRFFLQHFSTLSRVGLYALGYKFGFILSLLLVQPFYLMWEAQAYEIAKNDDASQVFARIFTFYSVTIFTAAFLLCLFIRETFQVVVDAKFIAAYAIVPLIAFAYAIQGLQGFFEAGLLIEKKSRVVGLIGLSCAVLCVGLNVTLIYLFGMWGAAISTLLSFSAISGASYYYSQRYYPVHCDWRPLLKVIAAGGVLLLLGWVLPVQSLALRLIIKGLMALVLILTIAKSGVFRNHEAAAISQMATEKLGRPFGHVAGWLFGTPVVVRAPVVKGSNSDYGF